MKERWGSERYCCVRLFVRVDDWWGQDTRECLVDSQGAREDKEIRVLDRIKSMKSTTSTKSLVGSDPPCGWAVLRENRSFMVPRHSIQDWCCFDCRKIKNICLRTTRAMRDRIVKSYRVILIALFWRGKSRMSKSKISPFTLCSLRQSVNYFQEILWTWVLLAKLTRGQSILTGAYGA